MLWAVVQLKTAQNSASVALPMALYKYVYDMI